MARPFDDSQLACELTIDVMVPVADVLYKQIDVCWTLLPQWCTLIRLNYQFNCKMKLNIPLKRTTIEKFLDK